MLFALYLTNVALAVCTVPDPVLVSGPSGSLDVHPDCYGIPGPPLEEGTTTDRWVLSLDAVDVQSIIEGTCSVEIDNQSADWSARARSSLQTTHDKVLRRELDTQLRLLSMTVYGAAAQTLTPDMVGCSGETGDLDEGVVFQVSTACPTGTLATLADTTEEACEAEQAAPILWTTLTTGALDIPDISADTLRDMVMLAMGDGGPCGAPSYPAVDIEFEREVYAMGSCASNVGNIEGEMYVAAPDDPVTVVLAAAPAACEDAVSDLTILECVPTLGPTPEQCAGTEPELLLSPLDGMELGSVDDPLDIHSVGPYVEAAVGAVAPHNGFDLMIPCDAGGTEPCLHAEPELIAVASGTIVNLRSWPYGASTWSPTSPGNVGFSIRTADGWMIDYNLETRIDCPSVPIPGDPLSIACAADVDAQIAALTGVDPAVLALWNDWLVNGGVQPAGIPVVEGDVLGTFAASSDGYGAHLHFGVGCAGVSSCPSSFYDDPASPDVFDWFDTCESDGSPDDCELNGTTLDAAAPAVFPLCH